MRRRPPPRHVSSAQRTHVKHPLSSARYAYAQLNVNQLTFSPHSCYNSDLIDVKTMPLFDSLSPFSTVEDRTECVQLKNGPSPADNRRHSFHEETPRISHCYPLACHSMHGQRCTCLSPARSTWQRHQSTGQFGCIFEFHWIRGGRRRAPKPIFQSSCRWWPRRCRRGIRP